MFAKKFQKFCRIVILPLHNLKVKKTFTKMYWSYSWYKTLSNCSFWIAMNVWIKVKWM